MSLRARYVARWVVPISRPPLERGAVLVGADGRIEAVGSAATVIEPPGVTTIDLGTAALLPGLVNTHAHPELAAFRGLLEDLPFDRWIVTLMRTKRAAAPAAAEWSAAARWTCIEAMRAGITTLAATETSGAALDALAAAGLRGVVYQEVFGPDPAQAAVALAELQQAVAALRRRESTLVRVGISPHAAYTVSDALFTLVAEFARAEALPVAVHAAEAAVEEALVVHGTGSFARGLRERGIATAARGASTIALLERTGLLRTRPLLIHCVRLRGDDVRAIAEAGASVAHCPVANARLGHGHAPVDALLDAGVAVGLGTDSVASNNRLDILEEARTAQLLLRSGRARPDVLPAAALLELATLGGARALRLDAEIGTLDVGKSADLCAVRLDRAHTRPYGDPCAAVVHAARGSDVIRTVVAGRTVFADGRCVTLDEASTGAQIDAFAGRLTCARDAL